MNEIAYWAEVSAPEPISVDEARYRIAKRSDVDVNRVYVTGVYARTIDTRNGFGKLIDYETVWEFQAEIRPKEKA
jgi:hypothetical protein